jgi:hypothetical protein
MRGKLLLGSIIAAQMLKERHGPNSAYRLVFLPSSP